MRDGEGRRRDRDGSADVEREIQFHLEARVRDLVASGRTPEEARAVALAEFGDPIAAARELETLARAEVRRRERMAWMSDLRTDLHIALRMLARQPRLAVALLLILALGIGSTAAVYTVVDAALLRPLPYEDADRLVHLWMTSGEGTARSELSYPDFLDWRAQGGVFAELEGYDPTNRTVTTADGSTMVRGARVTSGFFGMLGVAPAFGRDFRDGEDEAGGSAVVILTDRFWKRETGADPSVVGKRLVIDGTAHEVVGVLPAGFHFAPAGDAELWLPVNEGPEGRADRSSTWLNVVGRLAQGVEVREAQAALDVLMDGLARAWPEAHRGRGAGVRALRREIVGPVEPFLLTLMAAASLLLLVACVNVGGLLLTRGLARSREMAVRSALGASRARLARQLVVEGALLAGLGALLGLLFARVGVRALVEGVPATVFDPLPALRDAAPDARVVAVTAAVAGLAGVCFGLVPLMVARSPLAGGGPSGSRVTVPFARLRDLLAAAQLAVTVTLLIGAGLVGRSLVTLAGEDPGFEADRVLTARVALAGDRYAEDAAQRRFFEELLERLRALPGVTGLGAVTDAPSMGGAEATFRVEGEPEPPPGGRYRAARRGLAGDYLGALGVPVLAGRGLTAEDGPDAPRVVLVNESLARRLFPRGGALGKELSFYDFRPGTWRIVGVVGDVRYEGLDVPPTPTVYYSHLQVAENRLALVVRSVAGADDLAARLRAEVRTMDPGVPVYQARTMEQVLSDSPALFMRRYPLLLIVTFSSVAFVLGLVGVHGVAAQSALQRRRELGVRAALGATPGRLLRLGLLGGLRLVVGGSLAGIVLGLGFADVLEGILYGVGPADPLAFGVAVLLVGGTAMLACWMPARRAAKMDPAVALRAD